MADPFEWGVEDVVNFFCDPQKSLIDGPEAFAGKLREGDFDGELLLRFGIELDDRQLQEHLGLSKPRQQIKVAAAIRQLRQRSQAFKAWHANFTADALPIEQAHYHSPESGLNVPAPTPALDATKAKETDKEELRLDSPSAGDDAPRAVTEPISNHDASRTSREPARISTGPDPSTIETKEPDALPDHDSRKKRRIVPVNLSTEPNQMAAAEPNQPDSSSLRAELDYLNWTSFGIISITSNPRVLESTPQHWYLGKGVIRTEDIRSTSTTLSTRLIHSPDDSFAIRCPNHQPPGRRIAVWRETKRLFRANSKALRMISEGQVPPSRSGSIGLEDLPDLDDWDEETERQVQKDILETEAEQRRNKNLLTLDEVTKLIDDAIRNYKTVWRERKLPKYQLRAFRIWKMASRRRARIAEMDKVAFRLAELEERVQKYRKEMLKERYTNPKDVIRQAAIFEQTVEDICAQEWQQEVLSMRHPPPKPRRQTAKRPAPRAREEVPDGEEILMSSEDEMDFIVDDEDEDEEMLEAEQQLQAEAEAAAERPKQEERETSLVDLTQHLTPRKSRAVIDLTSPGVAERDANGPAGLDHGRDQSQQQGDEADMITPEMVQEAEKSNPRQFAQGSRARILVSSLWKLSHDRRAMIFAAADKLMVWHDTIQPYVDRATGFPEDEEDLQASRGELQPEDLQTSFDMVLLFMTYLTLRRQSPKKLVTKVRKRLSEGRVDLKTRKYFKAFVHLVQQAAPLFPKSSQIYRREALFIDDSEPNDEFDAEEPDNNDNSSRRRRTAAVEVVQNKDALDLREREAARAEELARRRERLRERLALVSTAATSQAQHIINESKQEHQGLIYVNPDIGERIKEHQVDGVRFLWNQIVRDAKERQGCLLAHTMGLGKTMQVITFLVALHEAAKADDPTVREQIPEDLRENSTLIICPAGLVDNWMDELLTWTPPNTLEPLRKIDATVPLDERASAIEQWSATGGVLVMGYEMLKRMFSLSDKLQAILTETPKIVVADEAHRLKNEGTDTHQVCLQIKTSSRIALTGSPLANNVEEYFHMINFVAPNFLGPIEEFRNVYSKDIEAGLYQDSLAVEKRHAVKMLQVLKETVAPKVHRATVAAVKHDLPNKVEFVISVAPTDVQRTWYNDCMEMVRNGKFKREKPLAVLNVFRLICSHPKCLYMHAKEIKEKEKGSRGDTSEAIISYALKRGARLDIGDFHLSSKIALLVDILNDARASHEKVLVFSTSIPTIDYLEHVLVQQKRRTARLDGGTSIAKRQNMTKNFNTDDKEVYLISTKAGGVGLNIQGASRVVLFDFAWNPMDEQQAIGRAYRIGQKKPVFVYHLVLAGTFEEDIHNKAVFKTQLASRVVDKKNPISWSNRGGELLHQVHTRKRRDLMPFIGKDRILDNLIKNHKGAISSIVSTDTFEEEDHTAVLTADDVEAAKELVRLNHLRVNDPAAYEREMEGKRVAAAIPTRPPYTIAPEPGLPVPVSVEPARAEHLYTPAESNSPSLSASVPVPSLAHSMDGASDYPNYIRSRTTNGVFGMATIRGQPKLRYHGPSPAEQALPAPQPIAGTNTYFGSPLPPQPAQAVPPPPPPAQSPFTFQTNLSQARDEFEKEFKRNVYEMEKEWGRLPIDTVISIVYEVNELRRQKGLGFLPDDAQWRALKSQLTSPRFTAAAAFRRLTPRWLALAEPGDIVARTRVLDEMSELEFVRFLEERGHPSDPTNIDNIRRPANSDEGGINRRTHANEDMKAMREAADKRRRSTAQLPGWAHSALSASQP
ncbi:type III restriction enzyme, res subunit domain-containing protein [Sarocladium implicatum]|nr:type III restriction enzyme, res subunit domain-containing protein [Sarocladium implicatum]